METAFASWELGHRSVVSNAYAMQVNGQPMRLRFGIREILLVQQGGKIKLQVRLS
jgi:hypothetical protein